MSLGVEKLSISEKASYEDRLKDVYVDFANPELFEKEYLPKVEKYRQAVKDASKASGYEIDASLLPKDLDASFDAVDFFYKENFLTEKEWEITDSSATSLVGKIAKGELTAVETFNAFAKRSVIANQFSNFAMQFFIDEGLKRAEELDEYYAKNGKTVGPLHGLPVSLKEIFAYEGKISHGSYVGLIDSIPEKSSNAVQILKDLGAVFWVRTTQPQTAMAMDSDNNIIGRTRNPYNLSLSTAGSSSGEGAIVSWGGSPLGVGTDIGGSVRAPAAFSGCFGFRPTTRRIDTSGVVAIGGGNEEVIVATGPLARSVDDIELFMEANINHGYGDLKDIWVIPIPWRKLPVPKPSEITIGVLYDDKVVKPLPPIERGLKEVAKKLEGAGIKIVEFPSIKNKEGIELVCKMYTCDGNEEVRKWVGASGEEVLPLTKWAMACGEGDKPVSITESRQMSMQRDELRNEYLAYMVENGIDFILSPANHNVANIPNQIYNWSYTAMWNILDMPGLSFQTGLFQDPEIDVYDCSFKPRTFLETLEHQQYEAEAFKGAPIALQLVGRRYRDEEVIAAGKLIVDVLGVDLFSGKK